MISRLYDVSVILKKGTKYEMKADIYNSLASISQAAEQLVQNIDQLKTAGLLKGELPNIQKLAIEQLRAEISSTAVLNLHGLENEIAARIEKERMKREQQLKSSH